jgi:hypothetical protein
MKNIINSLNKGITAKIILNNDNIYKSCTNPSHNICSLTYVNKNNLTTISFSGLQKVRITDLTEKISKLKNTLSPKKVCCECIWTKKTF